MNLDMPKLRVLLATALRDGPKTGAQVRKRQGVVKRATMTNARRLVLKHLAGICDELLRPDCGSAWLADGGPDLRIGKPEREVLRTIAAELRAQASGHKGKRATKKSTGGKA